MSCEQHKTRLLSSASFFVFRYTQTDLYDFNSEETEALKEKITGIIPDEKQRIAFFSQTPETALFYSFLFGKTAQLEPVIAQNEFTAYQYATRVLCGPFPLGEKAISQNGSLSYNYAQFLKAPFPAGEKEIAKDSSLSLFYALDVLHGAFPDGETVISQDPEKSYLYAEKVLKSRFISGEKAIARNASTAYFYAVNVIRERFPAGEKAILKNPEFARWYVRDIISPLFRKSKGKKRNLLLKKWGSYLRV